MNSSVQQRMIGTRRGNRLPGLAFLDELTDVATFHQETEGWGTR